MMIGRDRAAGGSGNRPRAAVVGSGVAGLTAAYLLQQAYDVTLYEADDRLGGHAHTHDVPGSGGRLLALDTGFLVHNARTYPNLLRLFGELGVTTSETEMSMSVSCAGCGLEYAGSRGARGLFPAPGALARPAYLAMLARIPSFYADARRLLAGPGDASLSLGEFLRTRRCGRYFARHFVVPLVAAVWLRPFATFRAADNLGDPAAGIRANVDAYLLRPDASGRAEADKDFYVSPFLPPAGRYRMRLPEPAGSLRLSVTFCTGGRPLLAATVTGTRRAYTPWRLLGYAVRYPWVTAQVSLLIRGQGLRLAARGLPVHPRPAHHPQEGVQ